MTNLNVLELNEEQAQNISKNLRLLIKNHGVSEGKIARALNTSVMTIRRVVSGETADPRISTLKLIADYFDVTIDSLLADNDKSSINIMSKAKPQFIPIIDWATIELNPSIMDINLKEWKDWYPIVGNNDCISDNAFAIESRPSMKPRFPQGTLFIINQNETPIDGDIILIKIKFNSELSLRELIIDPPKWQLIPIVPGSEPLFFDEKKYIVLGVVVLTILQKRK